MAETQAKQKNIQVFFFYLFSFHSHPYTPKLAPPQYVIKVTPKRTIAKAGFQFI